MEKTDNIEQDFQKWLVFSEIIKSSSAINDFEKAIKKKKSFKSISITTEKSQGKNKLYFISEIGNPSVLKVDEDSIHQLEGYFIKNYKLSKSENSTINGSLGIGSKLSANKPSPPRYLYSENKIKHGVVYSLLTLLFLQILIIPMLLLGIEFGFIGNALRYSIALIGLFFCVKYYKRYYDYYMNFGDFFLVVWNFNVFLFFFYFSEIVVLSIPVEIPDVTWTSFVFVGTLILGSIYLLVSSFIFAIVFNLVKKFI